MKRTINIGIMLTLVFNIGIAQIIDSMFIFPANPTTEDIIEITCYTMYGSSECELVEKWIEIEDDLITGNAIHCMMYFTTLCHTVDTFYLDPLSAGEYNFKFQPGFDYACVFPLFGGLDTIPFPWAKDSIQFTVTEPTSTIENELYSSLNIFPNPVNDQLLLNLSEPFKESGELILYATAGKAVLKYPLAALEKEYAINVSELASGIYFYQIVLDGVIKYNGNLVIME